MQKLVKPRKLVAGDRVAIVSLSSGILGEKSSQHQLWLGLNRLRNEWQLNPVFMPHTLKGVAYLADHPEKRAADLKQAFLDPQVKAIVTAIGGEDTFRLVPYLAEDPEFQQAVRTQPKIFTGFSDTTVDHLLLYQLGLETFYGPNFLNDLAELDTQMLPYTKAAWQHFFENPPQTQIAASQTWYEERTDFSPIALNTPRQAYPDTGYQVLRGQGKSQGRLLGGCLESLYSLLVPENFTQEPEVNSRYQLLPLAATWDDKILFLETSEEQIPPLQYQRMIQKLIRVGIIPRVRALVIGKPQNKVYYDEYQQILLTETAPYQTPILYNFNIGHAYPRTVLPYGVQAEIDWDQGTFIILEKYFAE
ncbi:LD-carboxypeptidase [Lactobacillus sp. DCY120]|uniref:LD-carboxypeptidase n=1 Tax=Bombilactobacillus apium TaxID=2675299 RepID=A0A850R322_9LACO|nr:S66 peptidase family protein [Bombilactobacillus apium]NVY96391.1 LD-carboxypeptidase [Bombilactobacillus apium]